MTPVADGTGVLAPFPGGCAVRADAVANRRRVLAAAREVFAEQGVEASTETVARRAGVGTGTVFRHFPTKRELVEHALAAHLDELAASAEAAATGDDPVAALTGLVAQMAEHAPTKLAMAAHLLADGGFGETAHAASQRVGVVVGEMLERAQATGRVRRDVGVEEIYFLVRGIAQAQAFLPVEPEVRGRAVRVLTDGLLT